MAHATCLNGHTLWDGDGKPCVEAYRLRFFRDMIQKDPDCVIRRDYDAKYYAIYDCTEGVEGEYLDIWYCDECGSFFVFVDGKRYDYVPCDINEIENSTQEGWEEYIAYREAWERWDEFMDFCEGKNPLDALLTFGFDKRYWLSPDKQYIVEKNLDGCITRAYTLAEYTELRK